MLTFQGKSSESGKGSIPNQIFWVYTPDRSADDTVPPIKNRGNSNDSASTSKSF